MGWIRSVFGIVGLFMTLSMWLGGGSAWAGDPVGHIYGKVTSINGNEYTGILRWEDEEAFWDDHFNSLKDELSYMDYLPREGRKRREPIRLFGFRIGVRDDDYSPSRVFTCRFGDIAKIQVEGDDAALLTMQGGTEYYVSGYANDVEATVWVSDRDFGQVKVKWEKIDTIEFMPAPGSVEPGAYRLHGTVESQAGEFSGWIQWDSQECLSTDELDGQSDDGEVAIEFSRVRSIERRAGRSRVELKDGRKMTLDGERDVDSSIRGIMVEDKRVGRVKISWDAFDRIVFDNEGDSGPGYSTYADQRPLEATVTDEDGQSHRGQIVFDLDETESWEFVNGEFSDVEYNIPFELIESIEPKGSRSSKIRLRGGQTVRLSNGQDVSGDNDGVLIFQNHDDDDPIYVDWRDVARIEFHW